MPDEPLETQGEVEVQQEDEKVTLTSQQYAALLDKLDEAEGRRKAVPLDELVEEGRARPQSEKREVVSPDKDIDEMTNKELIDYVFKVADASISPALQQLDTKIETIKVLREIDKLEKDPEYADFWEHKDKIYKVASDNPKLSLKDAYHLATGKAKKKDTPSEGKRPTLLTLPPRPVPGERPGPSTKVTAETHSGKSVKSAAERAWKETMGEKSSID